MTATTLTTVSGRQVDLSAPRVEDIDFEDIAEQLAKEPRYNGATPGVVYPVALHLVFGCDWILLGPTTRKFIAEAPVPFEFGEDAPLCDDPERRLAAAYYLCHDFHEAYLKDDTTPKKRALDAIAREFGHASPIILEAFGKLTERFDEAIHAAAGLAWPPPAGIIATVKAVDLAMLATEWRQLRPHHALPPQCAGVAPLPIAIACHTTLVAQAMLARRMQTLLPGAKGVNP